MNRFDFSNILRHPQGVNEQQTAELKQLLEEYPYFQSARAIYLKGLKNQDSYSYNQELKRTAAHTTDRSILFDYITSDTFNQNFISEVQQKLQEEINNIDVVDEEEIPTFIAETSTYDAQVLNPDLFEVKEESDEIATAEENLAIGKPLEFDKTETHSFQEWLKLSSLKPIERKEAEEEKNTVETQVKKPSKFDLIDKFIAENPKIKPSKKQVSLKNLSKENSFNSDELMTETLAKVYLEQKNYKKAKQAYRILSLKYPEKSGFFADRISEVEKIEINNTK